MLDYNEAMRLLSRPPGSTGYLALDLETYGVGSPADALDPRAGEIRLVSFCPFYWPEAYRLDNPAYTVDVKGLSAGDLRALLEAAARHRLVCHNAQFDVAWLMARGVFPERVYCTRILGRLLLAGRSDYAYRYWIKPTLQSFADYYLKVEVDKTEQRSDWGADVLTPEQVAYAISDVQVLPPLFHEIIRQCRQQGLGRVADIETRAVPAMTWMAYAGFPFDPSLWAVPYAKAQNQAESLVQDIRAAYLTDDLIARIPQKAGRRPSGAGQGYFGFAKEAAYRQRAKEILNSPAQLKRFLEAVLGFEVHTTRDDYLSELDHPVADLLRDYRTASTVVKMFGPTWGRSGKAADEGNYPSPLRHGRLFPHTDQLGAVSGRMTCDYPNIQQVPAPGKHPLGREFRAAFRPPDGRELVVADFSQIELRLVAEITGDRNMRGVYARGGDIHTEAAQWVLGIKEPTDAQRTTMKSANFALLYGAGPERFRVYARAKFGIKLTLDEATRLRDSWLAAFPGVREWHRDVGRQLSRAGRAGLTTETLAGRKRYHVGAYLRPEMTGPFPGAYSEALNTPVQGSGADLTKLALGELYSRRAQAPASNWFPVGVVHDEIILECDQGDGAALAEWLQGIMRQAGAELMRDVPCDAGTAVSRSWLKK